MKKEIAMCMLVGSVGTAYAKTPLGVVSENNSFETFETLPRFKNEIPRNSANTYVAKVLPVSDKKINDYYVFDKEVVVRKELSAYSTDKTSELAIKKENENSLLFTENVRFKEGAVLNLRTNFDENIADFVNFYNITLDNNKLLLRINDSSKTARFKKMPLLVLPAEAEKAEVELIEPLIIDNVEYLLKNKKIEDFLLYYVEPIYESEKMAEAYAEYEATNPTPRRTPSPVKSKAKLREKITVGKHKNTVFFNNIVDFLAE